VKGLPNVPVSGVARWVTRQMPVIQLSDRFKTHDHFWFTFFHEAAHLLLHSKSKVFLDDENLSTKGSADQKDHTSIAEEKEANAFAANFLLSEENYAAIAANLDRNLTAIESFSEKYKIHPGIIVGRLQHEGRLPYSVGNQYKCKLSFDELAQQPGPFHR
jgi:Zn-dependent peptidase ImmA (M78 family)